MRLGGNRRRRFCVVVACALLVACAALAVTRGAGAQTARRAKSGRSPNIIFVVADDLGRGDLGAYGQRIIRTPNLDRMAREGLRFTDAYAPSPVCAPSRASFMTGRHQGHARIRGNMNRNNERVPLKEEDVTVAEVLKTAGYRTGLIGKWGLGEPGTTGTPGRQGFDYFFGYLNQNHAHDYYPEYLWRNDERVNSAGTYSHDLLTREALAFIRREDERPFFLYLAYTLPHANNELTRKTGNGMQVPSDAPYTQARWTPQQRNYAAMVTRLDADVGELFRLLKELDIDRETVVVFTSDNGPQGRDEGGYDQSLFDSNGPFRGLKRELYEGGIRVPLIVRWPGHVRWPGLSNVWPVTLCDLMPTFAALAGVSAPSATDGVSLQSLLRGGRAPRRGPLYWEFHEGGFAQAVRIGRWKAVRKGMDGKVELYDLGTDAGETRDVAARRPEVVRRAEEIMRREHVESEDWPLSTTQASK